MAKSQPSMMFLTTTSLTATQKKLFNSPLFQLSNGSKELFHSNFLYWLSIVDWDMFVFVMRHLAGLSNRHKFRWEANHSPSKNNIKVLREHNHFDLSIYILDGKKWLPVLVLENKVKSFPDYKQLAGYEQKAMDEWKPQNGTGEVTFILLSLVDPAQYHISGGGQSGMGNWIHRSYNDLADILKHVRLSEQYHQQILKDYYGFIFALQDMANRWSLKPQDSYISKIHPWSEKKSSFVIESEFRLDDICQKIHCAQLLKMLNEKCLKRGLLVNYGHVSCAKNIRDIYISSGFGSNMGIVEIFVNYKDFCIGVQLQGPYYRHGFIAKVNHLRPTDLLYNLRGRVDFFFELGAGKSKSSSKFPWNLFPVNRNNPSTYPLCYFGFFKPDFVHQDIRILPSATINDVLEKVIEDIRNILQKLP